MAKKSITRKLTAWVDMQLGEVVGVSFKPVDGWLKVHGEVDLYDSATSLEFSLDWYSGEYFDPDGIKSEDIEPLIENLVMKRYGVS